jgi:carbonic anhydrase
MKNYNFEHFFEDLKSDIPSSFILLFVALPLCLGLAHASGAPQLSGIVAGIVGGIVVGFLSKSPFSVSGPTAGLTYLVLAATSELGSFESVLLCIVLAGVLQLFFGIIHAGILGSYIPSSVIKGVLGGIGIILILKQIPHLIGYDVEQFGVEEFILNPLDLEKTISSGEKNTLSVFYHSFLQINKFLFIIGMSSLLVLIFWESKIHPKLPHLPGPLVVVILATITSTLLLYSDTNIKLTHEHFVHLPIIADLNEFTPFYTKIDYSKYLNPLTYKYAILISVVASIETILSIEATDKLDPHRRNTSINRELISQGTGNIISGILGGLPITSVIVRSTLNISSGAVSKKSSIFHGVLIFFSVLFFSKFLNFIPLASLAAILCYTGYKLISADIILNVYQKGKEQFIPFLTTVVAIVFTDILTGTFLGSLVAIFFILKDVFYSPIIKIHTTENMTKVFLGENLNFLHQARIKETLIELGGNTSIVIDCRKTKYIHPDILDLFENYIEEAHINNIKIEILGIPHLENDIKTKEGDDLWASYFKMMEDNKDWVWEQTQDNPNFFVENAKSQSPQYLVIGCSDSRVPINMITKSKPGELFVHRNISNLVHLNDASLISALEYGIKYLGIKHIVVCGHYNCGGVHAALDDIKDENIRKWIQPIIELKNKKAKELLSIQDPAEKLKCLIEWNVEDQIERLKQIPIIKDSIEKTGLPHLHGWIYNLSTGFLIEQITPKKD